MAVGTQSDMLSRLQALMPRAWFPVGASPIRDGLLTGIANAYAFIYSLLAYIRLQTRIATASDGFLDLIAYDFFAQNLTRSVGQTDASFRASIISLLFRQRCTRQAIILVIQQLLGTTPTVVEPFRVADTGGWDEPVTMGWDAAGVWGDSGMPLECFVTVTVPTGGILAPPYVGGYQSTVGGYSTGSQLEYITIQAQANYITSENIYAALDSVRPVTGRIWTQIIQVT